MLNRKTARLAALAGGLMFLSTIAVLLARQFRLGPERPAPTFRTFGPPTALLRIEEYSDFACGSCRTAAGKMDEMLRIYSGEILLKMKHYPLLSMHPWSMDAAAYADCAGEQGKFREYAALLFESQEKWGQAKTKPEEFESFARSLNLNWTKMQACSTAPETLNRIKLDMSEAEMKGVNATPTFFINGQRAVGPAQLVEQARKFDNLLRSARHRPYGTCQ